MAVDGAVEGLKHTGTVVSRAPEMAADGLNTAFRHEHKMDYTDPRNLWGQERYDADAGKRWGASTRCILISTQLR